jgi:hypothetical protein
MVEKDLKQMNILRHLTRLDVHLQHNLYFYLKKGPFDK